jgi:diaminopimelate epimerase
LKFTKVQAAGNDFILIEAGGLEQGWPQIAIAMCHRHYGVGADGLLLLLPSATADFRMRVFNPDGSEAEACGNGLRCCARYIVEQINTRADRILLETAAGVREIKLHRAGDKFTIQVGMGQPRFGARDIPVVVEPGRITPILDYPVTVDSQELLLNFVSMGNPHAVYFHPGPAADFPLSQIGPKVEENEIFPNRVNFEVANIVGRQQIEARVWERGVGETLACGTGACAIAVIAQLHGYIDSKVDIKLPGGILSVEWDRVGEVFLSGPAEIVFTGEWPE